MKDGSNPQKLTEIPNVNNARQVIAFILSCGAIGAAVVEVIGLMFVCSPNVLTNPGLFNMTSCMVVTQETMLTIFTWVKENNLIMPTVSVANGVSAIAILLSGRKKTKKSKSKK